MTNVRDLLQRCQQTPTDDAAWSEFWCILVSAALCRVQKILRVYGLDPERAEDVLQELWFHLQKTGWAPLAAFRGNTEAELESFLRTMSGHFAIDWARKEQRCQWHAQQARREYVSSARDGPTEHEIGNAFKEVEALMSDEEKKKLRHISGVAEVPSRSEEAFAPASPVPERTLQRWWAELVKKFGGLV
jgi:DNA-directed RNA polymerase specialized sigma24 family protein